MSARARRPNPEVVAKHLDTATVLVHVGTDQIFKLNKTAGRVWQLLEAGSEVEQIERQLTREFKVRPARIRDELTATLAAFEEEELIATVPEA